VPGEAFGTKIGGANVRISYATSMGELELRTRSLAPLHCGSWLIAPVRLNPGFHEKVWAQIVNSSPGSRCPNTKIGEVWFTADSPYRSSSNFCLPPGSSRFRYIRRTTGQTEMWHILRAEPGAQICAGLPRTYLTRRSARGGTVG